MLSLFLGLSSLGADSWLGVEIPPALDTQNATLEKTITERGRGIALKVGEKIPDFGLVNQQGEVVRIRDLSGQAFVLNFIFTRCKVAKMCPASTNRMASLQREAPARGLAALRFVTITFDPAYDTPPVLNQYAKMFGIDPHNFDLLTYPRPEFIDRLLYLFGILTRDEKGTITHNSMTYLIDAEGRVALKQNGPEWSADKILHAAEALSTSRADTKKPRP